MLFARKRATVSAPGPLPADVTAPDATAILDRLAKMPADGPSFDDNDFAILSGEAGGLAVDADEKTGLPTTQELQTLKQTLHRRVLEEIDALQINKLTDGAKAERVRSMTQDLLGAEATALTERLREMLVEAVVSDIVGLGPLMPLLNDASVTEIMVNRYDRIYVERKGRLLRTNASFTDDQHILHIIERIVAPMGRRIDESSPMVDCRLSDGSRVNAIIPPLSVKGPCLTIRKFSKIPFVVEDLIGFNTLTRHMADFLWACVKGRLNILVSGGTGSGKTTTLNILSSFIPDDERIITIEDAAELQLQQEHVVTLESRPANLEGSGEITIRQLLRNALRMRPDRIVVGEARGGEALDMLQAMNTGHDGSLATLHANSPRDAISRLETMVLMAGTELPIRAIREQIGSALNLIIQQSRLRDGTRKIVRITEVQGLEGDVIVLQDVYRYDQHGMDDDGRVMGRFQATGLRPKFMADLEAQGITLPSEMFLQ